MQCNAMERRKIMSMSKRIKTTTNHTNWMKNTIKQQKQLRAHTHVKWAKSSWWKKQLACIQNAFCLIISNHGASDEDENAKVRWSFAFERVFFFHWECVSRCRSRNQIKYFTFLAHDYSIIYVHSNSAIIFNVLNLMLKRKTLSFSYLWFWNRYIALFGSLWACAFARPLIRSPNALNFEFKS